MLPTTVIDLRIKSAQLKQIGRRGMQIQFPVLYFMVYPTSIRLLLIRKMEPASETLWLFN